MAYPITKNTEILKALIRFHIPSEDEDFSCAMKAVEEIAEYISKSDSDTQKLRSLIRGELSMLDSEIDDMLAQD